MNGPHLGRRNRGAYDGLVPALTRRVPRSVKERIKNELASDARAGTLIRRVAAGVRAARSGDPAPPELPPGRYLEPVPLPALCRVLFVVLGTNPEQLATLARETALAQTQTMSFAPVFLTDCPSVEPLERYGYRFEFVMPERDWLAIGHGSSWDAMIARRAAALRQSWGLDTVLMVNTGALETARALLRGGFLTAHGLPAPGLALR